MVEWSSGTRKHEEWRTERAKTSIVERMAVVDLIALDGVWLPQRLQLWLEYGNRTSLAQPASFLKQLSVLNGYSKLKALN
jgi:hypothetical protein